MKLGDITLTTGDVLVREEDMPAMLSDQPICCWQQIPTGLWARGSWFDGGKFRLTIGHDRGQPSERQIHAIKDVFYGGAYEEPRQIDPTGTGLVALCSELKEGVTI